MGFLKSKQLIILAIVGGAIYFLFPSIKTTQSPSKQQSSVSTLPIKKDEKEDGFEVFLKQERKKELERLKSLGDSATPFDVLNIAAMESGGMVISTAENMGLSEAKSEIIREKFHQMEASGYYYVESVDDLSNSLGLSQELQSFFSSIGTSNYHDNLKNVNDHLRFPATDLDNSLFSNIERLGSQTYGSLNNGRWSSIKHFFKDPEFGVIRLNELQAGSGGTTRLVLSEELNEQVNGQPARYTVEVTQNNGLVLTSLEWVKGGTWYQLYIQQNTGLDSKAKAFLFDLADSLPDPSE